MLTNGILKDYVKNVKKCILELMSYDIILERYIGLISGIQRKKRLYIWRSRGSYMGQVRYASSQRVDRIWVWESGGARVLCGAQHEKQHGGKYTPGIHCTDVAWLVYG